LSAADKVLSCGGKDLLVSETYLPPKEIVPPASHVLFLRTERVPERQLVFDFAEAHAKTEQRASRVIHALRSD